MLFLVVDGWRMMDDVAQVFRPREKERYKLRKHRKNDLDSFRKLQQVKKDFEKVCPRLAY